MCGIVGSFYFKQQTNTDELYLKWCLQTMHKRGPDSHGFFSANNYATGFVRLAIQDLSEHGNQPMLSACKQYCITFNGEIYNAEEYKQALLDKGVVFKSTSDTEILLYTLIHFGIDHVLQVFDGMFAFAFYSLEKDELIIARDRVGIKPLYIGYHNADSIIYSSQYDHIINYKSIRQNTINEQVLANYLQLGFVADGDAIIHKTMLLPHGHFAVINAAGVAIKEYYSTSHLNNGQQSPTITEADFANAAEAQLISDVPLGTFLSGGIDSSLLTLLVNKKKPITAYTISTGNDETDEKERATWLAKQHHIQHKVEEIGQLNVQSLVDEHIDAYTEPFADFSSLPSLLVSKEARKEVTVILSGDGPDELFLGYNRNIKMIDAFPFYRKNRLTKIAYYILSKIKLFHKAISKELVFSNSFVAYYYNTIFMLGSKKWASKVCKNYQPQTPYFLQKIIAASAEKNIDQAMASIWNVEMNIHLQRILIKMDRASMHQSLEVRVPYLSNAIIEKAQQMHWQSCMVNKVGKHNIKNLLAKHVGDAFVYAPKKGFDVPMHKWMRSSLFDRIQAAIQAMPAELEQLLNKNACLEMLHLHKAEKENNTNIIWAIFVLIEWYKKHRHSYSS